MISPVFPPAEEEPLWNASQVAKYLGVCRSWVYRETATGRLPCVRLLGLVRYDPLDIRALKERGKQERPRVLNRLKDYT